MATNPNLWIWTTDWHLVSDDAETGILGEIKPNEAASIVQHIKSLEPAGVIDTGDAKDHYGSGTGDELDNYITYVRNNMPWGTVNAGTGINATHPILPGNHDEVNDYDVSGTDFSLFNSRFWSSPYHWTCDWAAPKIRFIAFHCRMIHAPDALNGFFEMDASEVTWVSDQLAALPSDWQAITCSHAPVHPGFGNEIYATRQGNEIRALLAANDSKIVAHLNGHRHAALVMSVLDGIPHFNGPGVSYSAVNANGGWMPMVYDPTAQKITVYCLQGPINVGPSLYGGQPGFTPIEITTVPPVVKSDTDSGAGSDTGDKVIAPEPSTPYKDAVLLTGPAIYYRMDEASGTLIDSSGNGHNAAVGGGSPTYGQSGAISSEPTGKAISFNGSTDWRGGEDTIALGDVFTVEAWVKRNSLSGSGLHCIASRYADMFNVHLNLDSGARVEFHYRQYGEIAAYSSVGITDLNWHHIVVTQNSGTPKVYVDGVDVTAGATAYTFGHTNNYLTIGADYNGAARFGNLTIDEVAIYTTVLTPTQVAAHYAAASATVKTGTDSGAGSDASALTATYAITETGAGTDASILNKFVSDTGTGTDTALLTVSISVPDTGTATENQIPNKVVTDVNGTTTENTTLVVTALTATDTGAGTDTGSTSTGNLVNGSDTGTSTENATLAATYTQADTGAGTENQIVGQTVTDVNGATTETTTLAAQISSPDTGTATEIEIPNKYVADNNSTATDAGSTGAPVLGSDAGAGSEAIVLTAAYTATETGTGTENIVLNKFVSETGTGADTGIPSAVYTATDSGTSTENASFRITAIDTGIGSDAGTFYITATDTGAGSDARLFGILVTESGIGLEVISAFAMQIQEVGGSTDLGSVGALDQKTGTDSGAGIESLGTRTLIVGDSGTSSEIASTAAATQKSGTDTGAGTDISQSSRQVADTGTSAEQTLTGAAGLIVTDSGSATENATNSKAILSSIDSSTSVEFASFARLVLASDTGTSSIEYANIIENLYFVTGESKLVSADGTRSVLIDVSTETEIQIGGTRKQSKLTSAK